ncbi:hypothetical protein JCM18899A_31240 [Nocardioides sp. AN3]
MNGTRQGQDSRATAGGLRELGARYFYAQHTYDPWNASLLGLTEFDDMVNDPSQEASAAAADELKDIRLAAEHIEPRDLAPEDQVDRAILISLARGAETDARDALWSANVSAKGYVSPLGLIFQTIPAMTVNDEAAHDGDDQTASDAYMSRMSRIGNVLSAMGDRYRAEVADGRTPTRVCVARAVEQLSGYLALPVDEDVLLGPATTSMCRPKARDLVEREIRPAISALIDLLRDELLPLGRPDDHVGISNIPDGEGAYERAVARHTTTSLTPSEIHEMGHQALADLHSQWAQVGERAFGITDPDKIRQRLRTDPALRFQTSDQIVAVAQAALDRATAALPTYYHGPTVGPCDIVEINAVEAAHAALAYYRPPAVDGSRNGAHCLTTTNPTARFRFEYESLAFHESVPGHHLQLASCQQLDIPRYRRHLDIEACSFNEGWGLYSELMAEELGLYSTDLDILGRLSFSALRACRLVIDTGIHDLGWTRAQAVDFMRANTATTEANIHNEVDRYIAWPGQALAYMVGMREIVRLRETARTRLGEQFSLSEFHRRVLEHGAVPLSVLATNVEAWGATPDPS